MSKDIKAYIGYDNSLMQEQIINQVFKQYAGNLIFSTKKLYELSPIGSFVFGAFYKNIPRRVIVRRYINILKKYLHISKYEGREIAINIIAIMEMEEFKEELINRTLKDTNLQVIGKIHTGFFGTLNNLTMRIIQLLIEDCGENNFSGGKKMANIEETIKIMLKGAVDYTDVNEITEKLKKAEQENRPLRIKLGLDPSAPDIHLGHAVALRKMKQLQDLGHEVIIIIGDFTGMIGDPTGKSKTRKQLTQEQVMQNAETYKKQIFKILDKSKTTVKFNSEWLGKMNFEEVIKLACNTTVARMLERDDFQKRYITNQPIALHEFFYPLMQGYDSVAIKSDIELGGTDQTFNVLMGRNIQKYYGQAPQITLFMPLLEGLDGVEKMSKSLGNYIGISEDANTMYEKAMKVPDELIIKYYNLCTDLHPDEVDKIVMRLKNGENPRDIKMELAKEITKLYHNEELANNAQIHFTTAFQKQEAPEDILELKFEDNLIDTIMSTGKYPSKGELRRLFIQEAVKINNEKVTDFNFEITEGETIIQIGKGNFYKVIK